MIAIIIDGLDKPIYADESVKSIRHVCKANRYEINTDNAELILADFSAHGKKRLDTC